MRHASGMVLVVLLLLLAASFMVWVIWFLKTFQIGRLRSAQSRFDHDAALIHDPSQLLALAARHPHAPGSRVVVELGRRRQAGASLDVLQSVAKRAIVSEQQRAGALMPALSSIASASPFVGLFGTVWGIMDAFLKIGVEKSASLPVVAPAIGEALIATAFGLVAAIPATIGFNFTDQKIQDLLSELDATSDAWVQIMSNAPLRTAQSASKSFPPSS
jgi:biopolymer transport protein TolQ